MVEGERAKNVQRGAKRKAKKSWQVLTNQTEVSSEVKISDVKPWSLPFKLLPVIQTKVKITSRVVIKVH